MTMLVVSYTFASLTMCGAALYLFYRLRFYVTASTMLVGSLLLIYGPAYLSFVLSSGEKAMVLRRLLGSMGGKSLIFGTIEAASADFGAILIAMNFSIALMFIGVVVGIELIDRLMPMQVARMQAALPAWNSQPLMDDTGGSRVLLAAISVSVLMMAWISMSEHHLATIREFLSISGDEAGRIAYRLDHGGSPNYVYRVVLGAVAPMFVIWGALAGWIKRSWPVLLATSLLFLLTFLGKCETLSKAPPAFFLFQLIVVSFLVFRNSITWRTGLAMSLASFLVLVVITRLTVSAYDDYGVLGFVYYRVFEVPTESLLETFGAYPFRYPHTWGANIRPLAILLGKDYTPAFSIVSQLWHGASGATSNALFIADAWVDFSYAGVIVFSILAGAICRAIDAIFLANGKTVVGIAVIGAVCIGIFTLLVSSLNTAALSGGLLLAPLAAGAIVKVIRRVDHRQTLHILRPR
jgi:hypothetical protein